MNENHKKAIEWATITLSKNNFPNSILISKCENVLNVKDFLEIQLDRMLIGSEIERKASYHRIKRLKDTLNQQNDEK